MDSSTRSEKISFVTGAAESMATVSVADFKKYFPQTLNFGESVKALDIFYEEPANVPIPVIWALRLITMKANGADPEAVERMTASIRRQAAEALKNP
jgi:hypothetical protein